MRLGFFTWFVVGFYSHQIGQHKAEIASESSVGKYISHNVSVSEFKLGVFFSVLGMFGSEEQFLKLLEELGKNELRFGL